MAGARLQMLFICAVLTLSIGVPEAFAGSEENPEVQDPNDDYEPQLPTHRHGDILSAWIHNVSVVEASITLKLATIASDSRAVYDVTWEQEDPFAVTSRKDETGVRATVDRGAVRWRTLERDSSTSDLRENIPLSGRVSYGTPGYLTWNLPRTATNWSHQLLLTNFVARSWNLDPVKATPSGEIDGSGKSTSSVTLEDFPILLHLATVPVPNDRPDLLDSSDDAAPGPSNVQAVWLPGNSSLSIVVQVSSLDLGASTCAWDGKFTARDPASEIVFSGTWLIDQSSSGWRFLAGTSTWGGKSVPSDLEANMGKPGMFRFSTSNAQVPDYFSLRESNFRLDMFCRNDPANTHDTVGRVLVPSTVPGPALEVIFLAVAAGAFCPTRKK